jgi:hypothetical protein
MFLYQPLFSDFESVFESAFFELFFAADFFEGALAEVFDLLSDLVSDVFFSSRFAESSASLTVSGWGFAIIAVAQGFFMHPAFALSTAAVTADTLPVTISVTRRPPSFLSQLTRVTSALLHIISSASTAATTPLTSTNPNDFINNFASMEFFGVNYFWKISFCQKR